MNVERRTFLKSSATLLGSGILLGSLGASTTAAEIVPAVDENIWDVFHKRRSVRRFKPDTVPEADIVKMLDAARTPPTSGNQQPWKFLVIRDCDKISRMKEACLNRAMERFDGRGDKSTSKEQYEGSVRNRLSGYFSAPVEWPDSPPKKKLEEFIAYESL